MNILLILLQFNSCCQNKLISVSVSVSVYSRTDITFKYKCDSAQKLQCVYAIKQCKATIVEAHHSAFSDESRQNTMVLNSFVLFKIKLKGMRKNY